MLYKKELYKSDVERKKEYFFKLVLFVNFVKGIDIFSKIILLGKEE